jgi:hypothetical protein
MFKTKFKILLLILLSVGAAQATDRYVVFLKNKSETNKIMMQTAKRLLNLPSNTENEIIQVYDRSLNGFSAKLDYQTVQDLKDNPEVKFVEIDEIISIID